MSKEQGLPNEQLKELRENVSIGDLLNYLGNRPTGAERFCGTTNDHLFLSNNDSWVDIKQKQSECSGNSHEQPEQ